MASRRFLEELMRELPAWEKKGLVSHGSADELRRFYGPELAAGRAPVRYLETLLSVLSAALVGGGIILIISHNWDMLSPAIRLGIGYVPLLAALALGFFTLTRRGDSPAWRESTALLIGATAASALAIVSQLYHLSGTLADYLFAWLIMLFPLIYLFKSVALTIVYSIALWVFWGNSWQDPGLIPKVAIFFALQLPMLIRLSYPGAGKVSIVLGRLLGVVGLLQMTAAGCSEISGGAWGLPGKFCWAVFFATLCVGGGMLDRLERKDRFGLVSLSGWIGVLWMLYIAGYAWFWREYSWGTQDFTRSGGVFFCIIVIFYALCVWYAGVRCRSFSSWLPVLLPIFLLFAQLGAIKAVGMILCNLLLAALGISLLVTGYRRRRLLFLNCGMGLLALQILLRFCSADDILVYALIFIILGMATAMINLGLVRKFRQGRA